MYVAGGGFPEWGIPGMIPVAKTSLAYTSWQQLLCCASCLDAVVLCFRSTCPVYIAASLLCRFAVLLPFYPYCFLEASWQLSVACLPCTAPPSGMLTTAPLAVAVIGLCLVVAFVLLLLCCAKRMSCVAERRFHIKITVEPLLCHATVRCFPVLLCAICVLRG